MITEWKKHPVQEALWFSRARFNYNPAGRQSGKTELALRRIVRHLAIRRPWPDPTFVYGAPTYSQVKRIAWQRLLNLIPKSWIADISVSELSISTVFGSKVYLVGLDKPSRIEGVTLDGAVMDENSDIKPLTFDLVILPMLVLRDGWCLFTGIPKRFGVGSVEFKTRYEAAATGERQDSAAFTWRSSDIIPEEKLAYMRNTMDERDFDEQFNASWISASGGIFHAFDKEYNCRPCTYDPSRVIVMSSDFNVNPHCSILGHIRDGILEVFDEIFLRDSNTPHMLDVLTKKYAYHKGGWQFYGDATGKARKTSASKSDYVHIFDNAALLLMGRSMHYLRSNPPKADRFAATNARICAGDGTISLYIDPRCKYLIADLENRAYKAGTMDPADSGDVGHMSDALGYLIYKLFPLLIKLPQYSTKITISTGV